MEEFKRISEVLAPAPQIEILGPGRIEELHGMLDSLRLSAAVSDRIRGSFNVARNVFLYSWFSYGLIPVAVLHTYAALEFALKEKTGGEKRKSKGLKGDLALAVRKKWIRDDGFRVHRRNEEKRAAFLREMGDPEILPVEPRDPQRYCRIVSETIPELRNSLAHGHDTLYPYLNGLRQMEICVDLINQLFVDAK